MLWAHTWQEDAGLGQMDNAAAQCLDNGLGAVPHTHFLKDHGTGLTVSPAKARTDGPIHHRRFADDAFLWKITPVAGVGAVHGVVSHDHAMIRADDEFGVGIGEIGNHNLTANGFGDFFRDLLIQMTEVMVFGVGCFEPIDVFEMRRIGIQTRAIEE